MTAVYEVAAGLDAQMEEARLEALRGNWEQARAALDEAKEYGRPRSAGLGGQIRRLLGQTSMVYFDGLVSDPQYAPADGDATALNEPMTLWEAHHRSTHNQREFSSYDDREVMAVGRAGTRFGASPSMAIPRHSSSSGLSPRPRPPVRVPARWSCGAA